MNTIVNLKERIISFFTRTRNVIVFKKRFTIPFLIFLFVILGFFSITRLYLFPYPILITDTRSFKSIDDFLNNDNDNLFPIKRTVSIRRPEHFQNSLLPFSNIAYLGDRGLCFGMCYITKLTYTGEIKFAKPLSDYHLSPEALSLLYGNSQVTEKADNLLFLPIRKTFPKESVRISSNNSTITIEVENSLKRSTQPSISTTLKTLASKDNPFKDPVFNTDFQNVLSKVSEYNIKQNLYKKHEFISNRTLSSKLLRRKILKYAFINLKSSKYSMLSSFRIEYIISSIDNDKPVLIGLQSTSKDGHAVLAYRYELLSNGSYKIYLYDPNLPFFNSPEDSLKSQIDSELVSNLYMYFTYNKKDSIWDYKYNPRINESYLLKTPYTSFIPGNTLTIWK